MFTLDLLQAINDWQRGGSAQQKKRRGERLKELSIKLSPKFRQTKLCCFRQLGLDKKMSGNSETNYSFRNQYQLGHSISILLSHLKEESPSKEFRESYL